jgi:hypothetical protein
MARSLNPIVVPLDRPRFRDEACMVKLVKPIVGGRHDRFLGDTPKQLEVLERERRRTKRRGFALLIMVIAGLGSALCILKAIGII